MTSKAAKMRAQLTKMQANREDFETTKRDLEVQVNRGKNNFGKIQRGLKNNEIVDAPIETVEEVSPHPPTGKKGHGNISPKGRNAHTYSTMKPNANDAENSQNAEGNNQITIPSGVRVSDWCYTAPLDSQPPMVKSNEVYEKIRPLGRGAFGDVYLVKNTEDNKLFANKTIFSNKESELKEVLREVKFLRSNRHPCIVDIHDVFVTAQPRVLNIILSYCEAGDLAKVISSSRKSRINIPESQIIKWTMQIGLALHFLHENGILHRDLKPNNVMLTEGGDLVKVADFGLACDTAVDVIGSNEAGTPCYTAPEMIQNMAYSFPTDCFSFGVMLHEFLRLELPFQGHSTADLVRSILQDEPPPIPSHYSDDLKAITYALLAKDPEKRLGFAGMLLHPLLQNKTSSFPSAYRPKALEERMRRAHMRHLHSQIDMLQNSVKSSTTSLATLLEGTPYESLLHDRKRPDSSRSTASEAGMRKSSIKSPPIPDIPEAEAALVSEMPSKGDLMTIPQEGRDSRVGGEREQEHDEALEKLRAQYGHGEIDDDCEKEKNEAVEAMKAEVRLSVADPRPSDAPADADADADADGGLSLPPIDDAGARSTEKVASTETEKDNAVDTLPNINP